MEKPRLSFWSLWNISFGYLGIQFGFGLQMANMSAIYSYLKADPEDIPILWLAAPLSGLIIQPIVGRMSDNTWGRLGRRRPFLLVGAILSSLALFLMPNSPSLWIAAGLLWVLDGCINISMQPFRSLVADIVPESQLNRGYAIQAMFIGFGAVVASILPWFLTNILSVADTSNGGIPTTTKLSFYFGGLALLGAVLWTIFRTKEFPPEDMDAFRAKKAQKVNYVASIKDFLVTFAKLPKVMWLLAPVQMFTWMGLFVMWFYLPNAVAMNVFGAPSPESPLFKEGVEWTGLSYGVQNGVSTVFAFILPFIADKFGRKLTHGLCLAAGAAGLIGVALISNPIMLMVSMVGVGIAWASIVSLPFAMLASSLPKDNIGVYMGIFNFFVVIPEILASLFFGPVMKHVLTADSAIVRLVGGDNTLAAVVIGGASMLLAALLTPILQDHGTNAAAANSDAGAQAPAQEKAA